MFTAFAAQVRSDIIVLNAKLIKTFKDISLGADQQSIIDYFEKLNTKIFLTNINFIPCKD